MSPELVAIRSAVYELRSAAMKATSEKHGGDGSRKWGKKKCIRGHDLYGPDSHVRRRNGKSDCSICANYLRRLARAEERKYSGRKYYNARLHTAFGRQQTMSEWSEEFGITVGCLCSRMRERGFTLDQALSIPARIQTQTQCFRGHIYTPATTIWRKDGKHQCRICKETARRKRRAKNLIRTGKRGD